jgi:CotS family spore coat protein
VQRELMQLLQSRWRCYVKSIRGRRKAVLLETSRGPLFVKGYTSQAKAQWVISLSEQLVQKGFTQTLHYIYGTDGLPFVPFNGKYYVAMKPINGRDAQYGNVHDIMRTISCLGKFHSCASGISGGPFIPVSSNPIVDKWEDRFLRFMTIIEQMKRSRKLGSLEQKIVRFSPYIEQEAEIALDFAMRSPLAAEYDYAVENQCVAHRDLASHNFLIGNSTFLIDYDTAMYDTQLVDLVQMTNRILDQQAWNFNLYALIMEQYQKHMALTEQQQALTYLMLRFPDNFMREVIGLYEGKSGFVSKRIDTYLTMIMKGWGERAKFFKGSNHFFYEQQFDDSNIVVSL